MSFVSRWTHTISRVAQDAFALSTALARRVRSKPGPLTDRIKDVLLQESKVNNSIAISFWKANREIGLVKYWGLAEYLKRKQETLVKANTIENPKTAKVAFMITSSMKQDLADTLGYTEAKIKTMTPQQASLVLHHKVEPEAYDSEIPKLEEAFRKNQQKEAKQESVIEPSRPMVFSESSKEETTLLLPKVDPVANTVPATPTNVSDPPLETTIESSKDDPTVWYEVIEIKTTSEETNEVCHGLYRNQQEALLALETREMIQEQRNTQTKDDSTFALRSVTDEEIQRRF